MTAQDTPPQVTPQAMAEATEAGEAGNSSASAVPAGLDSATAARLLAEQGPNEIAEAPPHWLRRFLKRFWGLSAWMLELIAALSLILGKEADFWVAAALLVVNAVLGFLQERRANSALAALRQRLNIGARVLRDGAWSTRPARELVVGDVVRVRAGDFIPADLQLAEGTLGVDQSALTGESREAEAAPGATVYAGATVHRGEATGSVVATGVRTYFGRTTELVANAHPALHVEEVIARVVRWLFIVVGVLVAFTLAASVVRGLPLLDTLPLALVLLMSAVPVALPVMFTVSMALGSVELARRGVLVTQLGAVEDAASMNVLCTDKTGTLTLNRLSLHHIAPAPGYSIEDVLTAAALASNAADADPIDLAFLEAATQAGVDASGRVLAFEPFSAATRRTEALVEIAGRRVRCVKGALRTVAAAAGLDAAALAQLESAADAEAQNGLRVLAVARGDNANAANGDGGALQLLGLAYLYDPPRADSRELIASLRALGIQVKMLTGDALPVARAIGRTLGLQRIMRASELRAGARQLDAAALADIDGIAEVFPEDKFNVVKQLQAAGRIVGMTGDGVNDAPALRQAEVGIAVSGATDVAKGAASAVLTHEGLVDIVDLVRNGRAIYQRVLTWIVNKVSRTILKAGFVVLAFIATGKFVISALGMVLLVFMTDFVKIALATDRVHPSERPESWNIGPLVRVAVVLGALMLVEALGMFGYAWQHGLAGAAPAQLQNFVFLLLLSFALFSIVSVRERRAFWTSRPSRTLSLALLADAGVGLLIAAHGMAELGPLPAVAIAYVVLGSALLVLGPNDLLKTVLTRRALRA